MRAKGLSLFWNGKVILMMELTPREFDVLYTLDYYHDQVLTTRQIYKAITGEDVTGDYHGIESSVYSIRKKLGRNIIRLYGELIEQDKQEQILESQKTNLFVNVCAVL